MTYRVRTNTGCNHRASDPCTRCWYAHHGRHGHVQGAPHLIVRAAYVMPGFPEDTMFDNAFDPWDRGYPVSSREQLREMCIKQGVDSMYLKESSVWRSGPTRWI